MARRRLLYSPVICLLLASCGDDGYDRLGSTRYYIDATDSYRVAIREKKSNGQWADLIPPQVSEVYTAQSGVYIVKQMLILNFDCLEKDGQKTLRSIHTNRSIFWMIGKGKRPYTVTLSELAPHDALAKLNHISTFPYVPDDGRAQKALIKMRSCAAF